MAIQQCEYQAAKGQVNDSFDSETGRLLAAFYSIGNPEIRQRIISIIRDVSHDEDAAEEILTLVAQALRISDLSDSP